MATKVSERSTFLAAFTTVLIVIWVIVAAFPFLWTLWGSFKVLSDFFSKVDWINALMGMRTSVETGGPFTLNGYDGAWIQKEF